MAHKASAALVGLDNPHSRGWLETLRHCQLIDRVFVCGEGDGSEADFPSLEALLAAEEIGFALVCTRNDRIPALAGALLQRGIPLIAEKPVARSAAEVEELEKVARARGVPWATGFVNRLSPVARELRRVVAEGALGEIVSIEGRMVTSSVAQRDPGHWLFDRGLAGGGILHWLGIHTVDLIRYLTGLEYAQVEAQVATLSGTRIDVEDVAALSFRMDNGALGSLHAAYVLRQRYGDISLVLRGTHGDATWVMWDFDGRGQTLRMHTQAPGWETESYREFRAESPEAPGYGGALGQRFVDGFIEAAQRGEDFVTGGRDALQALRLVEAAYGAAASGRRVSL